MWRHFYFDWRKNSTQKLNMIHQIMLRIADVLIDIQSEKDFSEETGLIHFKENDLSLPADVKVLIRYSVPDFDIQIPPDFEARNEQLVFYRIFKKENGLLFVIYSQEVPDEIQQIAWLDQSKLNWEIYIPDEKLIAGNPLKFPMLPIMMHYICHQFDAVMIHASCVSDSGKGRVFSGFSGAGKSTMSKIWSDAGRTIINDDRLIIRKTGDVFKVYNTPMYYVDFSKSVHLDSVFLIRHCKENQISRLSGAVAISRMLAFVIQNNFDPEIISHNLNIVQQIAENAGIYDLGVVPDKNIIPFVLNHVGNE